mmetsp:Transcript_32048/g.75158  ORF Transcript_32048/g.75158 Transcript_32048/m.75158 type:complete len:660 (+) Transcript_32048:31-2010(+)
MAAAGYPTDAKGVVLCQSGCGRSVAPGKSKSGQDFKTCCRSCAVRGSTHDPECDARQVSSLAVVGSPKRPKARTVDASLFKVPVKRLGVSGGTAPFFALQLTTAGMETLKKPSSGWFVGKDLSHTREEVAFYEDAKNILASTDDTDGLKGVLGFLFEYLGVLVAKEEGAAEDAKPVEMLVLRNLFDGYKSTRMLDIKIGEKTASSGWYGKSWSKAMYRSIVDGFTNSGAEGFRVAGFNGPPPSFASRDPLLDVKFAGMGADAHKKALRLVFSQMSGVEMFTYLLDLRSMDCKDEELDRRVSASELAEILLRELVKELVSLSAVCRLVKVPQKWVGSSVALTFDVDSLPLRADLKDRDGKLVKFNIFDWGRSELNTSQHHAALTDEEKKSREDFWTYYVSGIDQLAWTAARAYQHRFVTTTHWPKVRVQIFDFDSMSIDDHLGEVDIPLVATAGEVTVKLASPHTPHVGANPNKSTPKLVYSMRERRYPQGSHFSSSWVLKVHKACDLPVADRMQGKSDPYLLIVPLNTKGDSMKHFSQQSAVIINSLNPAWEEEFEFPVASDRGHDVQILEEALRPYSTSAIIAQYETCFPAKQLSPQQEKHAVDAWAAWIDAACAASGHAMAPRRRRSSDVYSALKEAGDVFLGKSRFSLHGHSSHHR